VDESTVSCLMDGFRWLRAEGVLCDVALSAGAGVGAERCLAHQAVLAAFSKPLRDQLLAFSKAEKAGAKAGKLLATAPQPVELKLENASSPGAVKTLLCQLYGEVGLPGDATQLATAFELGKLQPSELALGLQMLQSEGLLCDILLSANSKQIPAHQAVLASASSTLRRMMMDGMQQLDQARGEGQESELASKTFELELRGVQTPEALQILLDFLYGKPLSGRGLEQQLSAEACHDILNLACDLKLPGLKEYGVQWLKNCKRVPAQEHAAASQEEEEEPAPTPTEALPVVEEADEEEGEEADAPAPLTMQVLRFNSKAPIPQMPTEGAMEAAKAAEEVLLLRSDSTVLMKLVQLFWERPVWLEPVLMHALPASMDTDRLKRLLPYVAYQFKDGPWQQAYARLGWDPRENPEESGACQVLEFKDPKLKDVQEEPDGTEDVFFKKPPTLRVQLYQMNDIDDEFVKMLVESCELTSASECDRRCGFLNTVVMDSIRERLKIKAEQMREKAAAKQAKAKVMHNASKRAGAGKIPAGKRARVS